MTGQLLALVLAGHLIGDWIVQTDWQAANKASSWSANFQHMLGYHLTLIAFTCWVLQPVSLAALIIVSWLTHMIIDRRWPVIQLMKATGSEPFSGTLWGVICVDQALHLSILCTLAAILG